jgi:LmbE family N-acetylglucosaminyl deacetylase
MTFHPDHVAVHRWTTSAWQRRRHRSRLLFATSSVDFLARHRDQFEEWDMYMTDERPIGVPADLLAVQVVLTGDGLDRKLTALRAMSTQTSSLIALMEPDVYAVQVAEEAFVAATATVTREM